MVAPEDLETLCEDPYRVACPRGHTDLNPAKTRPTAYCRTCRESYPAEELIDRRRRPAPCNRRRESKD